MHWNMKIEIQIGGQIMNLINLQSHNAYIHRNVMRHIHIHRHFVKRLRWSSIMPELTTA